MASSSLGHESDRVLKRHPSVSHFPTIFYAPTTDVTKVVHEPGFGGNTNVDSEDEIDESHKAFLALTGQADRLSFAKQEYIIITDEITAEERGRLLELCEIPNNMRTSDVFDAVRIIGGIGKYQPKIFWVDDTTVLLLFRSKTDAKHVRTRWVHARIQASLITGSIKPVPTNSRESHTGGTPMPPSANLSSPLSPPKVGRGRGAAASPTAAPGVVRVRSPVSSPTRPDAQLLPSDSPMRALSSVEPPAVTTPAQLTQNITQLSISETTPSSDGKEHRTSPGRPKTTPVVARNILVHTLGLKLSPEQAELHKKQSAELNGLREEKKIERARESQNGVKVQETSPEPTEQPIPQPLQPQPSTLDNQVPDMPPTPVCDVSAAPSVQEDTPPKDVVQTASNVHVVAEENGQTKNTPTPPKHKTLSANAPVYVPSSVTITSLSPPRVVDFSQLTTDTMSPRPPQPRRRPSRPPKDEQPPSSWHASPTRPSVEPAYAEHAKLTEKAAKIEPNSQWGGGY